MMNVDVPFSSSWIDAFDDVGCVFLRHDRWHVRGYDDLQMWFVSVLYGAFGFHDARFDVVTTTTTTTKQPMTTFHSLPMGNRQCMNIHRKVAMDDRVYEVGVVCEQRVMMPRTMTTMTTR
jgi:hypothetical protein